jgi:hypothetical protein
VSVTSGAAISARSTSTSPGDHVAVLNLAKDGANEQRRLKRHLGEYGL